MKYNFEINKVICIEKKPVTNQFIDAQTVCDMSQF